MKNRKYRNPKKYMLQTIHTYRNLYKIIAYNYFPDTQVSKRTRLIITLHKIYATYLEHPKPRATCIVTGRHRAIFKLFQQTRLTILDNANNLLYSNIKNKR